MKLTVTIATIVGLFTTLAAAHREFSEYYTQSPQSQAPKSSHEALCERWDGPRCLDDEDKPSPFEEDYSQRYSPEVEREEALRTFERSKKNWELYFVELEKMKSEGQAYKPLQEVSDRTDIDAGTDTDW